MTFRARPSGVRPRTDSDRGDRRNALMNLGFTIVVVVAILLLVVAAGISWFNDHLAPAATVDGQTISKDAYVERAKIDAFRIELQERAIRTRRAQGTIRDDDAQTQLSLLSQQKQNLDALVLEHLIDANIQAKLATQEGVTVSDSDVDAKLTEEATTPELRHAWVIEVEPEVSEDATEPTQAQKDAAKAKAEQALKDLQGGQKWEDVARAVSTSDTKEQGGDLGYTEKESSGLDTAFVDALFAAPQNEPTTVIEGEDGTYRIGRVSEIVAPVIDPAFQQVVQDKGISLAAFRDVLRADVVKDRLSTTITDRVKQPGPQRHVLEIFQPASTVGDDGTDPEQKTGAVKTKHILFAPNDDPSAAAELPADDPAWKKAEEEARAAFDIVKADPTKWDAEAQKGDDGTASSGGKLPYFSPEDSTANGGQLDKDFADAIFKSDLQPGRVLEPVRSAFGWHVIQIWHRPTDFDWANTLKQQADGGTDFGQLAKDNSEAQNAEKGGDMGWIAKGQLPELLDASVFGTEIGKIGVPLAVPRNSNTAADAGVYLFKVLEEQTRAPEGDQLKTLEQTAFSTWYTEQKLKHQITRDLTAAAQENPTQ
jgi:parvulin-like peptidyl-prolyl isomerase